MDSPARIHRSRSTHIYGPSNITGNAPPAQRQSADGHPIGFMIEFCLWREGSYLVTKNVGLGRRSAALLGKTLGELPSKRIDTLFLQPLFFARLKWAQESISQVL